MAPRKEETPRIIDKRSTNAGSEYLLSITNDWVPSSTCRFINPELVELYEWLMNSGWHKAKHHNNTSTKISTKGVHKRQYFADTEEIRFGSSGTAGTTQPAESGRTDKPGLQSDQQQQTPPEDKSMQSLQNAEGVQAKPLEMTTQGPTSIPEGNQGLSPQNQDLNKDQVSEIVQAQVKATSEAPRLIKKPRLQKAVSCSEELGLLSIDTCDVTDHVERLAPTATVSSPSATSAGPATPSTASATSNPVPESDPPLQPTIAGSEPDASPIPKILSNQEQPPTNKNLTEVSSASVDPLSTTSQQVLDFNRNSEQMIEIFFNEGLDASGVEMFNTLLGPFRRPTPEFVAALFYAVALSPLTEPATIEATIHAFDRLLSMHGPESFSLLWDVQKRRRELSDGKSPFSKLATSVIPSATRLGGGGFDPNDLPDIATPSSRSRTRFGGSMSSGRNNASGSNDEAEFQTTWRLPSWNNVWDLIRTELGLDTKQESIQHIALQELAIKSRLQAEDLSPAATPRLDSTLKQTGVIREEKVIRDEIGRTIVGFLLRVLECDTIQSDGTEVLQMSQQLLLLLIRYIEAGVLSMNGRGLEDLGLEVISRLNKVNRDRFPTPQRHQTQQQQLSPRWSHIPHILERSLLDQTEIFLKMIIQGPCILDSGTGAQVRPEAVDSRIGMTESKLPDGHVGSPNESSNIVTPGTSIAARVTTGSNTGSSLFVLILIDTWFRNKTTSKKLAGFAKHFSFRQVIDSYSMPCPVRRNTDPTTFGTDRAKKAAHDGGGAHGGGDTTKPRKIRPIRKGARRQEQSSSSSAGVEDMSFEMENPDALTELLDTAHTSPEDKVKGSNLDKGLDYDTDDDRYDMTLWNAQHVEQVEWTVMMVETLVWAWIGIRGIRYEDIQGTVLEHLCFPGDDADKSMSWTETKEHENSGWQKMRELLQTIGGPLKTRWELLEMTIQTAVVDEELAHCGDLHYEELFNK
ncbi:hypothetical protein BGW38_008616 [Lunasporangiospora selenospora]|uniref:Uncharacterized protein n=1 Tax=Lunasporangiospora selenospora TaxID=979761 RepID=A0A9P6G3S1_9FUNG|nr:hypothetical protein BGW38_008616 [Lunasporangiospora selenospora]